MLSTKDKQWLREWGRYQDNFKSSRVYYKSIGATNNLTIDSIKEFQSKDQFYTKPNVAQKCYYKFIEIANQLGIDLSIYTYIEPSVGSGSFYNLLPHDRRIGIDIDPKIEDANIIKADYLKYIKTINKGKYIIIGNPPFGLRGKLALDFMNESFPFVDIIAFILPQLFNSDGKGVAGKRVRGYKLIYNEYLPIDSFVYPNGKTVPINTVFQIWTKVNKDVINIPPKKTCTTFIKVYSLSDGGKPSNTRNKHMLDKCDVYLPSTTFGGMHTYPSFEHLPHRRGYGVVILKNKLAIKEILESTDWSKIAFLSTNSALNLRTSLIEQVIIQKGFIDEH